MCLIQSKLLSSRWATRILHCVANEASHIYSGIHLCPVSNDGRMSEKSALACFYHGSYYSSINKANV